MLGGKDKTEQRQENEWPSWSEVPRVNCNVNCRFQVIMVYQCRVINCATLVGNADKEAGEE